MDSTAPAQDEMFSLPSVRKTKSGKKFPWTSRKAILWIDDFDNGNQLIENRAAAQTREILIQNVLAEMCN